MRLFAIVIAVLIAGSWPQASQAQVTSAIVRQGNRTLEVVGLRRWTPAMIQDSLDRYAPGESLFSHGCAATLRYGLGFAEAASIIIGSRGSEIRRHVVLLIEPQDSALVRHRNLARDTTGTDVPWDALVAWARSDNWFLRQAVWARLQARHAGRPPTLPPEAAARSALAAKIWAYLDRHAATTDADAARRILAESPYLYDRIAAVAILSSFPEHDATWYALTGALLESDGSVRGFAQQVLSAFGSWYARAVDWRPAAGDVHAVLNGGNLWALAHFMNVLTATGVGPELAAPFLRDGGHAVVMLAGMEYQWMRGSALELLQALSDEDYGDDPKRWEEWVAGLAT